MATDDAGLLGERFEQALVYAARLHARQTRKAKTTPYISHLMAVASMVLECGGDEDEAISALLHDAAEDQGGQSVLDEISKRFGQRVAGVVAECSDSLIDSDAEDKQPWRERKEVFLARLRTASSSCRLVTACDKLHNIGDVLADHAVQGDAVFERFSGGAQRLPADGFVAQSAHGLRANAVQCMRSWPNREAGRGEDAKWWTGRQKQRCVWAVL